MASSYIKSKRSFHKYVMIGDTLHQKTSVDESSLASRRKFEYASLNDDKYEQTRGRESI